MSGQFHNRATFSAAEMNPVSIGQEALSVLEPGYAQCEREKSLLLARIKTRFLSRLTRYLYRLSCHNYLKSGFMKWWLFGNNLPGSSGEGYGTVTGCLQENNKFSGSTKITSLSKFLS